MQEYLYDDLLLDSDSDRTIFLGNLPESIRQLIINYYNRKQEEKRKTPLCFEAVDAGATIALKCNGDNLTTATFQTSTDGNAWTDYTYATSITLTNAGDRVYFRAKDDNTAIVRDRFNYLQFTTTQAKKVNVSGNILSLFAPEFSSLIIDLNTFKLIPRNLGTYYLFYRLFCNREIIVDRSNLDIPFQELHLLTAATTTVTCSIKAKHEQCNES